MTNALNVIYPYKYEGMWVFDDERVGLDKEPFVEGAHEIIDYIIEMKGIRNAESGFRIIFSSGPFPNYDLKFEWVREGEGGNWYRTDLVDTEGWLCPALLKYFDEAPREIYARVEEKDE